MSDHQTEQSEDLEVKMKGLNYLVLISSLGCFLTSAFFGYLIYTSNLRRILALGGDTAAANRVVLPCYQPLLRYLCILYFVATLGLAFTFIQPPDLNQQFFILQYCSLIMLATFSIAPVLLLQTSVSKSAFRRTAMIIFVWFFPCSLLWGYGLNESKLQAALQIVFWLFASLPSIIIGVGMLTKLIPSRMHIESRSNRSSIEYMVVYGVFFGIVNICSVDVVADDNSSKILIVAGVLAAFSTIWTLFFPLALHRTLLADTKYWRGIGKHNQGGLVLQTGEGEDLEGGGEMNDSVHRPTMDLSVATTGLQKMLNNLGKISIDFAFLSLEKKIGEGASAHVYRGKLKKREVAVKVFTPEEVTLEIIQEYQREAQLSAMMRHSNLVKFVGVCVRPPQIAMVMELCTGGNLKSLLTSPEGKNWSPLQRILACLDAARAVKYLHTLGFIHRDIKAENFFISQTPLSSSLSRTRTASSSVGVNVQPPLPPVLENEGASESALPVAVTTEAATKEEKNVSNACVIKLGDFGEAIKAPTRQGDQGALEKMSIVGTVAFMAPELIAASKHYTEKVDIYSLAITMWEIWTSEHDPWGGMSTFKIYDKVGKGERPLISQGSMQPQLQKIIESAWQLDPEARPSAAEIAQSLESLLQEEFDYTAPDDDPSQRWNLDDSGAAGSKGISGHSSRRILRNLFFPSSSSSFSTPSSQQTSPNTSLHNAATISSTSSPIIQQKDEDQISPVVSALHSINT